MGETTANVTGSIADQTKACLANQPVNTSDVAAYSLHSAPGRAEDQAERNDLAPPLKIRAFSRRRRRRNALATSLIVMPTEVEKKGTCGETSVFFGLVFFSNLTLAIMSIIQLFISWRGKKTQKKLQGLFSGHEPSVFSSSFPPETSLRCVL